MEAKQVIVMRKFPKDRNMRTGKYCAQAAHASLAPLLRLAQHEDAGLVIPLTNPYVNAWLTGRFKKITVYVDNDEDLIRLYKEALTENLPAALIQDAGLTEFDGVPTYTAVGIGPGDPEIIDKITGKLPLF